MKKFSRKKLVISAVFLQSLIWLLLLSIGYFYFEKGMSSNLASILVIIIYVLFVFVDSFIGLIWTSWMRDLIDIKTAGQYFGRRSKILGSIGLVSMLIAGYILDYFKRTDIFVGFAILFGIAFLARSISALIFIKQYEPEFIPDEHYYFSFKEFVKKMFHNNFGKFVIFVSLIIFATAIASPFFTVYMLNDLKLSYVQFIIISMCSTIASLIFVSTWGRFTDIYGNAKVIKATSFLIPFVSFTWALSLFFVKYYPQSLFVYLLIIEGFSGIIWSGFNLAVGDFLYDAVTRQRLSLCVSYFNILRGIGTFIGAGLGALLVESKFGIFGLTGIIFVFVLSGIIRLIISIMMYNNFSEVKEVKEFGFKELFGFLRNEIKISMKK